MRSLPEKSRLDNLAKLIHFTSEEEGIEENAGWSRTRYQNTR